MLVSRNLIQRFVPNKKFSAGFTLVEIMVAVSIFAVVALIVVGALITATRLSRRAQTTKLVMDNLDFALQSMSLWMRSGSGFYCYPYSGDPDEGFPPRPPELPECTGVGTNAIVFDWFPPNPINPYRTLLYRLEEDSAGRGKITFGYQYEGAGFTPPVPITSKAIDVKVLRFNVRNLGPNQKPLVTVVVSGAATVEGDKVSFALQTSLSKR